MRDLSLAHSLFAKGKYPAAEQLLQSILRQDPNCVVGHVLMGMVFSRTGHQTKAEAFFESALQLEPDQFEALVMLALALKERGELDRATALARKAIDCNPGDAAGYNALGLCLYAAREFAAAAEALTTAVELEPRSAQGLHNLGLVFRALDMGKEALDAFKAAQQLAPQDVANYVELFQQLKWMSNYREGIPVLEEGVRIHPNSVLLAEALASAYGSVDEADKAEALFRQTFAKQATCVQSFSEWLFDQGRFDQAVKVLEESLRSHPAQGYPYYGLAEAKRFESEGKSLTEAVRKVYDDPALNIKDHMFLEYALARDAERLGDFKTAMECYVRANASAVRVYGIEGVFDPEGSLAGVDLRSGLYPADQIERLKSHGLPTARPIFIVGMIRSGTTLLDQIVSAHPAVCSVGERQFWRMAAASIEGSWLKKGHRPDDLVPTAKAYLNELAPDSEGNERFVDKMPLNFLYLGLIHCALPDAKILHIRRSPLDTCLSIFTTHLGPGPHFAYDRDNIVAFYRCYQRAMGYWRSVLPPDRFLELNYEELVNDRETVIRGIVEFLGLPWDVACLHHESNVRAVPTPSRWQARQPVYSTSVERWKRYEPWLGPLAELKEG